MSFRWQGHSAAVSLLVMSVGLLTGCTSGTFVPSPAVVNITGDWTGKCTGTGCIETDMYLRLNQGRNTVEGTFSAGGRSQYSRSRPVLTGLVAERKFTFDVRGDAGDPGAVRSRDPHRRRCHERYRDGAQLDGPDVLAEATLTPSAVATTS